MRKGSGVVLGGLVALIVLAMGMAGCGGQVSGQALSGISSPFITDRVVQVRIVMSDEDWSYCRNDALMEQYVRADFWFDGELVPDVAVRPKGNSSLNMVFRSGSPRLSLKVDFNFFNSARTFRGLKKLNLNNGFNDPTFIREALAYGVFEEMGLPTPRTSFVDLWVNDTHLGLYTQVEQIDKTFLGRHFSDTGGNLYKPEMPAAFLLWTEEDLEEQRDRMGIVKDYDQDLIEQINLGGAKLVDIMQALERQESSQEEAAADELSRANPAPRERGDYIDDMGLKTNESYADHKALFRFLDVLNNEPEDTFPEEIEKVLDVDEALRFLAVATLVGYYDSYLGLGHNYYFYEVDGRFTIIPWDLNGAFATFTGGMSRENIINCYIDEPTCGPVADRPLIDRLLSCEPYREVYHGYLEELLDGPFSVEAMFSRIDELADMVRPFVHADELKFYSTEVFERGIEVDVARSRVGMDAPQGGTPPPPPQLSQQALNCLKGKFDAATLEELRTRRPTPGEMDVLKSCLTPQEVQTFLRGGDGPPPSPGALVGATFIGLKTYVAERGASVRQQLRGLRPSRGDGSGNGGKMFVMGGWKK